MDAQQLFETWTHTVITCNDLVKEGCDLYDAALFYKDSMNECEFIEAYPDFERYFQEVRVCHAAVLNLTWGSSSLEHRLNVKFAIVIKAELKCIIEYLKEETSLLIKGLKKHAEESKEPSGNNARILRSRTVVY